MFFCFKRKEKPMWGHRIINIQKQNQYCKVEYLEQIGIPTLLDPQSQVVKYIASKRQAVKKLCLKQGKPWLDEQFPPGNKSFGCQVKKLKWMRLSDFLKKPQLFLNDITMDQVEALQSKDHYFMAAIAAIAGTPFRVCSLFRESSFNPLGFYTILCRIKGVPTQILIDDYLPVFNESNLFRKQSQHGAWPLLLQKVWAKLNSSYLQTKNGYPRAVLQTFTMAPCMTFYISELNTDKLLQLLLKNTHQKSVMVAGSRAQVGQELLPNHAYCLLSCFKIKRAQGALYVIELKGNGEQGEWIRNIQPRVLQDYGITSRHNSLYFSVQQFSLNFTTVDFSMYRKGYNYLTYNYRAEPKRGNFAYLQVDLDCDLVLSLYFKDQEDEKNYAALFLARQLGENDYQLVNCSGQVYHKSVSLPTSRLTPGTYLIYFKVYNLVQPVEVVLSTYCSSVVNLCEVNKAKLLASQSASKSTFYFSSLFSRQAIFNSKNEFDQYSWIHSQLYSEVGFGCITLKVRKESSFHYRLKLSKDEFRKEGLEIKKPLRGGGFILVRPGQSVTVVCRVKNLLQGGRIQFPPRIQVQRNVID